VTTCLGDNVDSDSFLWFNVVMKTREAEALAPDLSVPYTIVVRERDGYIHTEYPSRAAYSVHSVQHYAESAILAGSIVLEWSYINFDGKRVYIKGARHLGI